VPEEDLPQAAALLARLRAELNRPPGAVLHWNKCTAHSYRLHIAKTLGTMPWLRVSSVVVAKPHLTGADLNDDKSYLYTLRYLLERLSWMARDEDRQLSYTLAHIKRFQLAKLRAYEARLRAMPDCTIAWEHVDPHGGRMEHANGNEYLQLADSAASAIFRAFEPDEFGNIERRYLEEMSANLYRRPGGAVTSYGLKIHPTSARAAHPWVAAL
jgi:hypothetical protein